MTDTQKTVKSGATAKRAGGFSAEERAAMRDRVKEVRAEARGAGKADGEAEVRAKIAEMQPRDRKMAERIHAVIKATAPSLTPRTWYGMPAYSKDGKVLCYFKAAAKFSMRYATFGFSDIGKLDEGTMWPTDFAIMELTPADEERIAALVRRALG